MHESGYGIFLEIKCFDISSILDIHICTKGLARKAVVYYAPHPIIPCYHIDKTAMENCFGIVEDLGPSEDQAKHMKIFKNVVEFDGRDYIILTTENQREDITDMAETMKEHQWKIATLVRHISSNVFQIVSIEPFTEN